MKAQFFSRVEMEKRSQMQNIEQKKILNPVAFDRITRMFFGGDIASALDLVQSEGYRVVFFDCPAPKSDVEKQEATERFIDFFR